MSGKYVKINPKNYQNISEELKSRKQWTLVNEDKCPINPIDGKIPKSGKLRETWASFQECLQKFVCGAFPLSKITGLAYHLTPDDGFVYLDFDDIESSPDDLLLELNTYTELSNSKKGLRVIGRGKWDYDDLTAGKWTIDGYKIELYTGIKQIAFTGFRNKEFTEIRDITETLEKLHSRILDKDGNNPTKTKYIEMDYQGIAPQIGNPIEDREAQFRTVLRATPGTQSGQNASGKAVGVCKAGIIGFALPLDNVVSIIMEEWAEKDDQIDEYGHYEPWTESQIRSKCEWVIKNIPMENVGSQINGVYSAGVAELIQEVGKKHLKTESPVEKLFKEVQSVATEEIEEEDLEATTEAPKSKKGNTPAATVLVNLSQGVELWHEGSKAYATIDGQNHAIKSSFFSGWLKGQYFNLKKNLPPDNALKTALAQIEYEALQATEHKTYLRCARIGKTIYWDLGGADWEAIEITAEGWRIIKNCPVKFRRSPNTGLLPMPEKGGNIELLRKFLNTTDENWTLIKGYLLDCWKGYGPYSILCVSGVEGSAKSWLLKLLRQVIDPVKASPLNALPRDEKDIGLMGQEELCLFYDNVSFLENWQSDSFCRIATGSGIKSRKLYTDNELCIYSSCNPIAMNGIPDMASRRDLLDRSICILQPRIDPKARKEEREIVAGFAGDVGKILGSNSMSIKKGDIVVINVCGSKTTVEAASNEKDGYFEIRNKGGTASVDVKDVLSHMESIACDDLLISDTSFVSAGNDFNNHNARLKTPLKTTDPMKVQKDGVAYIQISSPVIEYDEKKVSKDKIEEIMKTYGFKELR